MTQQSAKMLVEAGVIPKNILQQLVNWRLLPEDSVQSHGRRLVTLDVSKPAEVDRFVTELAEAITKDMAEFRETELDHPGGFKRLYLEFALGDEKSEDVFVDRLGRLIVPNESPWPTLVSVQFPGEKFVRTVIRKEERFEGDKVAALVVYVNGPEDIKNDLLA